MIEPEQLNRVVKKLVTTNNLESSVQVTPPWANQVIDQAARSTILAFEQKSPTDLLAVHRTLKTLYDIHLFPNTPGAQNQYNPYLGEVRKTIEDGWMSSEAKRSSLNTQAIPTGKPEFADYFQKWVLSHPAANHKVYDYLEKKATTADMHTFFRDEQPLDVRFFDIVVMAAIGSDGSVRQEVSQNMWDESGGGEQAAAHTTLYRTLLTKLGINKSDAEFSDDMGIEALAGYNLFQYLGQNRGKYNESVGALGATELLDPPLYSKFMKGARRLGLDRATDLTYYSEHISIDVFHGDGWINRVMLPVMDQSPTATTEFMRGAEMRLHTAGDYYDAMERKLIQGK